MIEPTFLVAAGTALGALGKATMDWLSTRTKAANDKHLAERADHEQIRKDLRQRVADLEERNDALGNKLDEVQDALRIALSELEILKNARLVEVELLRSENTGLRAGYDRIKQERDEARAERDELRAKIKLQEPPAERASSLEGA